METDDPESRPEPEEGARRVRFRDRQRGWLVRSLSAPQAPPRATPPGTVSSPVMTDLAESGPNETDRVADSSDTIVPADDIFVGSETVPPATLWTGEPAAGRRLRLIGIAIIVALIVLALVRVTAGPGTASSPAPPAAPSPVPFSPRIGPPLHISAVLGGRAGLAAPREAIRLMNGRIAVADTGNHRVVLLDRIGHPLRAIDRGATAFKAPFALARYAGNFLVLDAERGAIDELSDGGVYMREIVVNKPVLVDARGLATAPDGSIWTANPRTNSIVAFGSDGAIRSQLTGTVGVGAGPFNQPSDVAVTPKGTLFVVDNENDRVVSLSATGTFRHTWAIPASDTQHSAHVLPIPGSGFVVSDPGGALVFYSGTGIPISRALPAGSGQPLGLSLDGSDILVTDDIGNRILSVGRS